MIGRYLRWTTSRDAMSGTVWARVVWIGVFTTTTVMSALGLATSAATGWRLAEGAACVLNGALLWWAVRVLRGRLNNRQYVQLTRQVKAAIRGLPDGVSANWGAGVILTRRCRRLVWWWPVQVDSLLRTAVDDIEDVRLLGRAAVMWESFSARRDRSPIMRSVDGMTVRAGDDGELDASWTGGDGSARRTLESLASGLADVSADELRELQAQIEGAEPVPTESE